MPCDRVMSLYDKHRDECLYSSLCLCIYDERRYTGSTLKNLVLGHGCSCKGCSAMYLIGGSSLPEASGFKLLLAILQIPE